MRIEDAIKQRKFRSSFHKVTVNLMYTANWLRDLNAAIFRSFDLQPQHYNILRIISGRDDNPVSPGEIKDVMIDKGVDLTRLVDKLVKLGLVDRRTCESNRRKVDLTLTEKGKTLLDKINPEVEQASARLKNNLTEKEAEQLSQLLDKLRG